MTNRPPDWSDVLGYFMDYFSAMAILAAMQLDLFTPLRNGPRTCDELARALKVDPRRLRMLLTTLAGTKLLTLENDQVANSPLAAEFLVKGQPRYMGGSHELYSDLFSSVLPTAQSVRTGTPQAEHDWDSIPDDQLRAVLRGLNAGGMAQGRVVAQEHSFSRFGTMLDIGGGGAGFSMGACQACPNLTVQVVELPRVARLAQELIDAAGLTSRVKTVAHDIAAAPLRERQPAAVVRNVLQVLSPERAQRVITNVARSLEPSGAIFVIGHILDDDLTGPAGALAFNLVFLNIYRDGEAYAEAAYRRWLESAGFIQIRRAPLGLGHSILTGRLQ